VTNLGFLKRRGGFEPPVPLARQDGFRDPRFPFYHRKWTNKWGQVRESPKKPSPRLRRSGWRRRYFGRAIGFPLLVLLVLFLVLFLQDRLVVSAPVFGVGQSPESILALAAAFAVPRNRAWGVSTAALGLFFPIMTGRTGLRFAHVSLLRVGLPVNHQSSSYSEPSLSTQPQWEAVATARQPVGWQCFHDVSLSLPCRPLKP
jgi:hypothetical protein